MVSELPPSSQPWRLQPYGNTVVYVNEEHAPRIFADSVLTVIGTGGGVTPPPPPPPPPPTVEKPPLYSSSVTGTDFEYITEDDPSAFQSLEFQGFKQFEMPDKRPLNPKPALFQDAYVFKVTFNDGTSMLIAEDKAFGSQAAAQADADRYTPRLGKLPKIYREVIKHLVVHKGGEDTTAFAEDKGHFFTIYSGNATKRIGTHDLEETFFHEGSHAAIQVPHMASAGWKNARTADNAFITDYAKTGEQEDFAESALFAYTVMKHPERFPPADRTKIEAQIPNRIAFFRTVFT